MKILITGGAGFIGSNLALELEKQGNDIVTIDNFSSGNKENLRDFKGKIIDLDVSYPFNLNKKFDAIIHEASITDTTFKDDGEMIRQNVEGFKNVIKLAQKNNAKLIYASSAGTYGNGPVPMKENQKPMPLNAYAKSKLMMDESAKPLMNKMHIVGLKYFNVFGQGEKYKGKSASMIYQLAMQIKSGKNPRVFKHGEQLRDYVYIKDAVKATMKAIEAKPGIYNVGTGIATSFNKIIKLLNKALRTNKRPEYFDNPIEDVYQNNTQADTTLAEKKLGFKAEYNVEEGISEYVRILK